MRSQVPSFVYYTPVHKKFQKFGSFHTQCRTGSKCSTTFGLLAVQEKIADVGRPNGGADRLRLCRGCGTPEDNVGVVDSRRDRILIVNKENVPEERWAARHAQVEKGLNLCIWEVDERILDEEHIGRRQTCREMSS